MRPGMFRTCRTRNQSGIPDLANDRSLRYRITLPHRNTARYHMGITRYHIAALDDQYLRAVTAVIAILLDDQCSSRKRGDRQLAVRRTTVLREIDRIAIFFDMRRWRIIAVCHNETFPCRERQFHAFRSGGDKIRRKKSEERHKENFLFHFVN